MAEPTKKSLPRRLFEAFRDNKGLRLSVEDVELLMANDAIAAWIANTAASDAGYAEPGAGGIFHQISNRPELTWEEFGEWFNDG